MGLGHLEEELALHEEQEDRLRTETAQVSKEVASLVKENARLAGHQNTKQKIKHLQSLKEEVIRLKHDNTLLERDLSRCQTVLQVRTWVGN